MPIDMVYLICIYPIAIHVFAENYILLNYITIISHITPQFNELTLMIYGVFYYDFGFLEQLQENARGNHSPGAKNQ